MKYFNALMVTRSFFAAITFLFSLAIASRSVAMSPAELAITGDWQIKVTATLEDGTKVTADVEVPPSTWHTVAGERHESLPVFNPKAGGWAKGDRLQAVLAQECITPFLIDPASLVLRVGAAADSKALVAGRDYDVDLTWGTFGRRDGGSLKEGEPVFANYRHGLLRIDSIVLTADRRIELRVGEAKSAAPTPPALRKGEQQLANVWLPGVVARLAPPNLFPILETAYPEPPVQSPTPAEKWLPSTLAKLRDSKPLRVLAWGDSVTDGRYLPGGNQERWQEQLVSQLRKRYPKAQIELITEAWGGRNTSSYFGEPPGSEHNYAEKVLARKPDLIISEFVNDAGFDEAGVEERYGKLLKDFQSIGAEWIILTPHYVRPDWMNLKQERDIDADPRHYVTGLRQFAAKHHVALADASLRYGRLWRQGIPYSTLMLNSINHPNAYGMRIFVDSILALFPNDGAAVQAKANDSESLFISDHPEVVVGSSQSWGVLGWNVAAHDASKAGELLRIGGHKYERGLGHHATGAITILLDDGTTAFDAEVGLQPCAADGSVVFRVVVDGETRYESKTLHSGDAPVAVHVPLAGASELRLEAADGGDGISCDMANWANARLTRGPHRAMGAGLPGVDIGKFARVVTWDPNRNDGARADRIQEFRADDLFLDRNLTADSNGRFSVPTSPKQLACIGLQWLNRRALREVRLPFCDAAQIPPLDSVRVEGWFGESAWQGQFKPLKGKLERIGEQLVFRVAPRGDDGGLLQTRKVRWIFPVTHGAPLVSRLQAFTRTRWVEAELEIQIASGNEQNTPEIGISNGEIISPASSDEYQLKSGSPTRLTVRYAKYSPFNADTTVLPFRFRDGAFGVSVNDVLKLGYVFVPGQRLLVASTSSHVTLAEVEKKLKSAPTILEQVRQMPDQTFAQAMTKTHHAAQNDGPVMLSLACDNAKFVVERNGRVRFNRSNVTDTKWAENTGEMQPQFGDGHANFISRKLDGGWLPSPLMTFRDSGVTYAERVFVAPTDKKATTILAVNRPAVCVAEFTISNDQSAAADVRLSLNFVAKIQGKRAASVRECPHGWLVSDDTGPIALVAAEKDNGLSVTVKDGALSFAGKLPPQGKSRIEVFLRARNEDLLNLPTMAQLRTAFETYWKAALASAMQVETPDPLLNDVIRSSQVRCLIAARNEADGKLFAVWAAAMSYGPLESESHSVIRGMSYFGHEEFARRSLDYFIRRYNQEGFLTTGYTTFGTAWHLWTVGEHYELYHDDDWLSRITPEIARVGEWIVRQIEKTSQPAGKDRPEFGLMPPGVMADWNAFAYHFANNAYYYAALRELGIMLAANRDARSTVFAARSAKLKEDTLRAYRRTQAQSPVIPLRNGAWVPHYPSQVHSPGPLGDYFPGQDAGRSWCYDVEIGAHQLVPTGVLDAKSRDVDNMLNHMEDVQFLADGWFDYPHSLNQSDWFNLGGFSKVQPYYTRNAEIYALRDDVKPFVRSYFNTLAAMLNQEVLTIWEHFNHSGAWDKTHETGYFLHQTRMMLVQERGDELWLAPLITNNWLKDGMSLSVTNAPTRFGRASYDLTARGGVIEAKIEPPKRSAPAAIVIRLRHPEGKKLTVVTVNGRPHAAFDPQNNTVRITSDVTKTIVICANY
jgi:lysophospholipase L1-like esterase